MKFLLLPWDQLAIFVCLKLTFFLLRARLILKLRAQLLPELYDMLGPITPY